MCVCIHECGRHADRQIRQYLYMYMYIYIYIDTHTHVYLYIERYIVT
jgi:hypothetical protein